MRKWLLLLAFVSFSALPVLAQQPADQTIPLPGADALSRAQQALQAEDYETAVLDTSLFILLNPTFSQGYYLRGVAYAQLGDPDRALADLDRASKLPSPNVQFTASLFNIRSIIHVQQGDAQAALADLSAGIEAAPEAADLYLARANLYGLSSEWDKALADYEKAIQLDDSLAAAYAGRGFVHFQQQDTQAALDDYNRALELNPNDTVALVRRASIYLDQEDYDLALADVDKAILQSPNEPGLYLSRGAAYNGLGESASAAASYREWLNRVGARTSTYQLKLNPGESLVFSLEAGIIFELPFDAAAGQTLRLSATTREGATTDPLIVLLDPQGNPVAADDDGGGEMNARIDAYPVVETGTYTLLVGHAGGSPDGPVRVLLEVVNEENR